MSKSKLFAKFATDENREESGVWVDFGDGIKVRIRRLKSRKSLEVRRELDKPFADVIRRGAVDEKTAEELLLRQLSQGVIVDWEGIEDQDGTPLTYTTENAYRLLKQLPEFRDEILQVSVEREAYKVNANADAEKN